MHRAKLILMSGILLTMLVSAFFVSGVSGVALAHAKTAAPNITCGKWNYVKSPNPGSYGDDLTAVAAVSASDVWAVGNTFDNIDNSHVLSEHYDGTQWSVVSMPAPAGSVEEVLLSLAAISTSDVWTAGYYYDSSYVTHTLIEQWNGSAWNIVPSPDEGTLGSSLSSITAVSATDIWVVGSYQISTFNASTLTEQWNGTSWSIVASPNGAGQSSNLNSVSAVSSNAIWAIGSTDNATLVEKWNGTAWKVVNSPNRTGTNDILYNVVAISSTDVWADGSSFNSSTGQNLTLMENWNGTKWKIVSSPTPSSTNTFTLYGIAAASTGDVWATGADFYTSGITKALIEHWNGTKWSLVAGAKTGTQQNELTGVAVIPGTSTFWSVGLIFGNTYETLTEYYC